MRKSGSARRERQIHPVRQRGSTLLDLEHRGYLSGPGSIVAIALTSVSIGAIRSSGAPGRWCAFGCLAVARSPITAIVGRRCSRGQI
jgi:hypothetical protein